MKVIKNIPANLVSKLKIKDIFTFAETKTILEMNDISFDAEDFGCEPNIIVTEDIRFPLAVGYWPFPHIILVKGILDLSGIGLTDSSARHLPHAGNIVLSRNKFVSPNFEGKYNCDIDLSGNKMLISVELGITEKFLHGSIDLSGCNLSVLSLGHVEHVSGDVHASNNRIASVDPTLVVEGKTDLSNNFLTHVPATLTAELAGNPVQPSDDFDTARW